MTKQTWRTEKLRSADMRRSVHQRVAKSAREIRGERRKAIDSTAQAAKEAIEEVLGETNQQRIIVAEEHHTQTQTDNSSKGSGTFLTHTIAFSLRLCGALLLMLNLLEVGIACSAVPNIGIAIGTELVFLIAITFVGGIVISAMAEEVSGDD